jgi:hypothetical protein
MVRPDESEVRSGIVEEKLRAFGERSPHRHSLWNITSPTKTNVNHVSSPPPIDNSQRTQSSHALFQPVNHQQDQNENEEDAMQQRMQPPFRRPSTNVQQLTKSLSNVSKIGQLTSYQGDKVGYHICVIGNLVLPCCHGNSVFPNRCGQKINKY